MTNLFLGVVWIIIAVRIPFLYSQMNTEDMRGLIIVHIFLTLYFVVTIYYKKKSERHLDD